MMTYPKVSIIIFNWNGLEGARENRETNHLWLLRVGSSNKKNE
jgi:hypothetical protein